MTDESVAANGSHDIDTAQVHQALLSSSTKQRILELDGLHARLTKNEIPETQYSPVLDVLFETLPLYIDNGSRQSVERCLSAIFNTPDAANVIAKFAKDVDVEAKKPGIAPGNAFVLVRWASLLLQHAGQHEALWKNHGLSVAIVLTNSLNTLLVSNPKESASTTAIRVSRRAFRALLKAPYGTDAVSSCITALTAKSTMSTSKNALTLGVIAGVCSRSTTQPCPVDINKHHYISFYLREILGSRSQVPKYIAASLDDFFSSYISGDELEKELIPAVEKALLRSPEVVLNDLVAPLIQALPESIDLSAVLHSNLMKPLLSNTKSTNASVREGAVRTFSVLSRHSHNEKLIEKVADEILAPMKSNKVTVPDQRAIYAELLSALPVSAFLVQKIPPGLIPLAAKETNELAAAAEIKAIATCVRHAIKNSIKIEPTVIEAFTKGLSEKRLPVRRLWAIQFAECMSNLSDAAYQEDSTHAIFEACIGKLLETITEVLANPVPAVQNGLVSVACVAAVLCLSAAKKVPSLKASDAIAKAKIADKLLALQPKPSFILSPRIYTKLTAEDDLKWFLHSLIELFPSLSAKSQNIDVQNAWAQALIYVMVSHNVTSKTRTEAVLLVQKLYATLPQETSDVIINGLWQWCEDVETDTKDSAGIVSKSGRENLFRVVKAICLDPATAKQLTIELDETKLRTQLRRLLILCRSQLIPHVSWIEMCLRMGVDPGALAKASADDCLKDILVVTDKPTWKDLSSFQEAAFNAAAELAFVAPEAVTPLIVAQIALDLDPAQLEDVGPEEAAIYRTPEGTAFIDVLAKQGQTRPISKNDKDYDTLKWEEELRAQLAQKKGQQKKFSADEQAKVNAQLKKESAIRSTIVGIDSRLRRGIGIITALATGPPTEAEEWFGPSVKLLFEAIRAGAGLVLGDTASLGYLRCSEKISSRLGPLRSFVGVATLRSAGITMLPENLLAEPLGDLVTRLLYRLRFLGEQRPFDNVTLSYILSFIFLVLEQGGIDRGVSEEADEQILLAIEVLSFHAEVFTDSRLPRQKLLSVLTTAMLRYTQHFKPCKDCFTNLCRYVAPTMISSETDTVVKGTIVVDSSVRSAVLQAISAEMELSDREFYAQIWLACFDDDAENANIANDIWEENELKLSEHSAIECLPYLESKDPQLRRAAARAIAAAVKLHPVSFSGVMAKLQELYVEFAKPRKPELDRYGMALKKDLSDPWEARHGIALCFGEMASTYPPEDLLEFLKFTIKNGPLGDKNGAVRDCMVDATSRVVSLQGSSKVEPLMKLCEDTLEATGNAAQAQDLVNEAVVILYGALARHLPKADKRVPAVVNRLLSTLSVPSESVQYAVAQCLPPLVQASSDQASQYLQQMIEEALHAKKYAARRGAAYGLSGIIKGKGIALLKDSRLLSTLRSATENKKDPNERQGAFLVFELLSLLLGRTFEPYVIQIVPQLLSGFGDTSSDVREACLDAAKTSFSSLSSYGVKQVLPTLLEGLEDQQWRSKKGACDSLGAMAYLDPQQLAVSLPEIIPPLTDVLNDSHKEVRASANRSLQRFGEVINNPEVKSQVSILLKALSDPTKYTDDALDALIKVSFIHYLDAPSLALVVRILERGLGDRSATKRKAAQIIGSLAHLTERKDLIAHLPILVAGLRVAIVDPVPTTRATASKALGSTIEKLGEDALPDLIPSLMSVLKSDTGAGDRLGSAQALSEVLAGLGTSRLEETLPTILQNVSSSKASVREGFMSLFIFLPACFGNSFANYLAKIIPPILSGLADDVESIRETALRAGRLLVKNFASRSVDLLLPELERGLADDSYRIRLSSVELVGDLLFNLTGISGKTEAEDVEENANEAGESLLEVLGEEKRNKVLSALYICRCDTSGLVRTSAMGVWKALVYSPRTLRELVPTLTQFLIRRLASSNMEQKVIASNALGELIRKAGEGVLATLLPTLEEGLQTSTDTDAREGICIALRELINSASADSLEDYEKTLISVVRTALVDSDGDVREAAAEAFDSLQKILGKRAVDQVLPYLLTLLRSEADAENALSALLTLLTEATRSNIILPNLLPTLLTSPISAFNARALASLAEVASSSMTRRLPNILNALMDNLVVCKDDALRSELDTSFGTVLLSVDEYDGLNAMMSVMLALARNDDHRKRAAADSHLAKFFETAEVDFSRYHPDLIRALLIAFDDSDSDVVKAAWNALNALTQKLRKEEMESLVVSTRQTLNHVGVTGHSLPGFSLPKGINAILPIFLQGLMNGTAEQRTQAALGISDLIDRASAESLRPFVTQITGPLIRVVSERSVELKAAILLTLNNLLEKIPTFLKPFLPQLQRTFAKSLADPSSEILRSRAAKALGTLITMTPRVDPLIAELVTGSKTTDAGVRNAMLTALYEVVSKAGTNMNEISRNAILGLIDSDTNESDAALTITYAKLLGALIKVLPEDLASTLIKGRVLTAPQTNRSILALNAVLVDSPTSLTGALDDIVRSIIVQSIGSSQPFIADNAVLAAGKYLLTESGDKSYESTKLLIEALADVLPVGRPVDTRRLSLVVIRTASRENTDVIRAHLATLVLPVFRCVRDPVIPVKLAAEAAFLAIFSVVDEESTVFDKYMTGPGSILTPADKRSMQEYFKRIALRLSGQAKERREAEGGQGGLGLSSDEREDEREVWCIGKVDLGDTSFEG